MQYSMSQGIEMMDIELISNDVVVTNSISYPVNDFDPPLIHCSLHNVFKERLTIFQHYEIKD